MSKDLGKLNKILRPGEGGAKVKVDPWISILIKLDRVWPGERRVK